MGSLQNHSTLDVDQWPALCGGHMRRMAPLRAECSVMRLHSYRDESHSRHFDLIGGGGHPWSIDLVCVTASPILMVGFGCALAVNWIYKSFARCLAEVWEPLAAL